MPAFFYKAVDPTGALAHGEIEAQNRSDAYRRLLGQKLKPVHIQQPGEAAVTTSAVSGRSEKLVKLSTAQLLMFTEELADLLESGLQLEPALRVIEQREERSPIKPVAAFLRQQIREGKSFSAALRECRGSFSELYVNMVAAGETAGALDSILRRQAQYTAVVLDLQKRVVMALIYPCIVFVAGILLLSIFMLFLLPQLSSLLMKTGRELPLVTRLLIGMSEFMGHYWWAIGLTLGAIFLAHRLWAATPSGRRIWDRLKLQIPLVGPVLKMRFLAQFLQTLATLVSNGVVLLSALILVRNATANTHIRGIVDTLATQVGEGASLSRCMKKTGFFPAMLMDIISA